MTEVEPLDPSLYETRWILNTSYEEYSAGTLVGIIGHRSDLEGVTTVYPLCETEPDIFFDVPTIFLTQRRNRTDNIKVPTREQKRVGIERKQTPESVAANS